MRKLSANYLNDLKHGLLKPILEQVKRDNTLCLQIRNNYVNIYYRGGNILKIEEKTNAVYKATFNEKYAGEADITKSVPHDKIISDSDHVAKWLQAWPTIKGIMDMYFYRHQKNEREFQQLIVRENNTGKGAKYTDYFVCDIEYAHSDENQKSRFDIVAACWPSTGQSRKDTKNIGLSFIEMKYADSALAGSAGLRKHLDDMNNYLKTYTSHIKAEMKEVFNQLLELGLIDNQHKIEKFSDKTPELIFLLANHDPAKTRLKIELKEINPLAYQHLDIKFAVGNFMGYGLFIESIYNLDDFLAKYDKQISSKS